MHRETDANVTIIITASTLEDSIRLALTDLAWYRTITVKIESTRLTANYRLLELFFSFHAIISADLSLSLSPSSLSIQCSSKYTQWARKNRPSTCQLIMSSKSYVHLK